MGVVRHVSRNVNDVVDLGKQCTGHRGGIAKVAVVSQRIREKRQARWVKAAASGVLAYPE